MPYCNKQDKYGRDRFLQKLSSIQNIDPCMSSADCSKLECWSCIAFNYRVTSEQFKNYSSLKAHRHFTKLLCPSDGRNVNKSCKVSNSKERFAELMMMIVSC